MTAMMMMMMMMISTNVEQASQATTVLCLITSRYTVFQKKFTLFVFTVTKSDVDQF